MPDNYSGQYKKAFEEFMHYYVPDLIVTSAITKTKLNSKKLRVCRFCKRGFPDVTFNKEAHVLPQFLGNSKLIHDIECDTCNEKFGKYETSFADSIGFFRTADGIKGQRGVPKFRNSGLLVYSEKNEFGNDVLFIEADHNSKTEFDEEQKTIRLSVVKSAYTPIHVMKCLFKIGYSLLNDSELEEYFHLEKIINTTLPDDRLKSYCSVLKFSFKYYQKTPIVITFKKRYEFNTEKIPTKVILLYFGRFMYQYILLNSKDEFMIQKGGEGRILYSPPYLHNNELPESSKVVDFSGTEKRIEEENLIFTFD